MIIKKVKLSELKNNTGQIKDVPKNPRFIRDEKFAKLVDSLRTDPEMLEIREIVAYDNDGELVVIMGNMRLRALKEIGVTETIIKILPVETPAEKLRSYIIRDNVPFGENSWDDLANEWDADELIEWGMDLPEFDNETVLETEGDDDVPEVPKNIFVVRGDIFEIKANGVTLRVGCLDSTNSDDIEKLTKKTECELLFTSPPYSDMRTYGDKSDLSVTNLIEFIPTFLPYAKYQVVNLGLQRKNYEIVEYWQEYIQKAKDCGYKFLSWNVWDKMQSGSIASATAMFLQVHEWIFVFGKEPKDLNRIIPNQLDKYEARHGKNWKDGIQSKVRNKEDKIEKTSSCTYEYHQLHSVIQQVPELSNLRLEHPAIFPVLLVEQYILSMTNENDFVAEPFCGSGTTAIACLKTKRNCFTNDISENYVQVAVKRIIDFCEKNNMKYEISLNGQEFDVMRIIEN